MIIEVGGQTYEFGKENAYFVKYPNDLMDGLFVDLDDNYLFFSEHFPEFWDVAEQAQAEGVGTFAVQEGIDLNAAPHKWIVNSLARIVIAQFELESEGQNGE